MPDVSCKCGNAFNVPDEMAGKVVPCPQCGANIYVKRTQSAFGASPRTSQAAAFQGPQKPPSTPMPPVPGGHTGAAQPGAGRGSQFPPAPPPGADDSRTHYQLPPQAASYPAAGSGASGASKNQHYIYIVLAVIFYLVSGQYGGSAEFGKKLKYGNMEVFYTSSVTEYEARSFGNYMLGNGWGKKPCSIQLNHPGKYYEIRLVVEESYISSEDFVKSAELLARMVSGEVFKDSRVDIHLCDNRLKTVKVVNGGPSLGKLKSFGKINIYRSSAVTEDEAVKLGNFLVKLGIGDVDALIQLDRVGNVYQFRVVVSAAAQQNPKSVKMHEEIATQLSRDIFDRKRVEVHMCDEFLKTRKVVYSKTVK